jgi:hypothetical protein
MTMDKTFFGSPLGSTRARTRLWSLGLGMGLLLPLAGCPGDDTGTTAGETSTTDPTVGTTMVDPTVADTTAGETTVGPETTMGTVSDTESDTDTTTGGPMACLGAGIGAGADGDACTSNSSCASGVCTIYTDVPLNDDAVCAPSAEDCSTRVTGTVFDFITREPLSGADVIVAAALQAATNPTGAMALLSDTSDGEGRIDATSDGPILAPIGIVALSSAGGYYLTATGVAAPAEGSGYNVANSIHDLWAVPEEALQDWTDELAMDASIPAGELPLGDAGGVVGLVRDGAGQPVANAVVTSTNAGSGAFVRYLEDDGSFSLDRTSVRGIFVILDPALAEQFQVTVDGAVVGGGTAGSANGAIFTLIVNAD